MTEKLKAAGELLGIPMLDHIIVTEEQYYSFKEWKGGLQEKQEEGGNRIYDDCL